MTLHPFGIGPVLLAVGKAVVVVAMAKRVTEDLIVGQTIVAKQAH